MESYHLGSILSLIYNREFEAETHSTVMAPLSKRYKHLQVYTNYQL